jgi:hypothetical protein
MPGNQERISSSSIDGRGDTCTCTAALDPTALCFPGVLGVLGVSGFCFSYVFPVFQSRHQVKQF